MAPLGHHSTVTRHFYVFSMSGSKIKEMKKKKEVRKVRKK